MGEGQTRTGFRTPSLDRDDMDATGAHLVHRLCKSAYIPNAFHVQTDGTNARVCGQRLHGVGESDLGAIA